MPLFDFFKKNYKMKHFNDNSIDLYNEILNICDDIDKKLLEVENTYDDIEDDFDELDSVFLKIEEYNTIISTIRNKQHDELNIKLLKEVKKLHYTFLKLYSEFNLLTRKDAFKRVKQNDKISISDVMAVGIVGHSIYKKHKKEKKEMERKGYREELRNTWGLSEYEIDLVESGEYEPGQFSEEELEDDDYYEKDL